MAGQRNTSGKSALVAVFILIALAMVALPLMIDLGRFLGDLGKEDVRIEDPDYPVAPFPPAKPAATPEPSRAAAVADGGTLTVDIFRDFRYVDTGIPKGLSNYQTAVGPLSDAPDEAIAAPPADLGLKWGAIRLGVGADPVFTFAVGDLDRDDWTLWVDLNNNEDLTDDGPPLRNSGTGRLATHVEIPEVEAAPGAAVPYRLWFWVQEKGGGRLAAKMYSASHLAGEVVIGGVPYRAAAFERSKVDGRFRESGLWIDLDQNGRMDPKAEHFKHGDAVVAGGTSARLGLEYP